MIGLLRHVFLPHNRTILLDFYVIDGNMPFALLCSISKEHGANKYPSDAWCITIILSLYCGCSKFGCVVTACSQAIKPQAVPRFFRHYDTKLIAGHKYFKNIIFTSEISFPYKLINRVAQKEMQSCKNIYE